jgi:hypothetical protein
MPIIGNHRSRSSSSGLLHSGLPFTLAFPCRLPEIATEPTPLRGARDNRGFARHDPHPELNQEMESQTPSFGHPAETRLN